MSTDRVNDVFVVDDINDQRDASDGYSRYGAYLADRPNQFRDGFDDGPLTDPAEFAAQAFTIAIPPIMAPGYVRVVHPRVVTATTHWDDDHRLAIELGVAVGLPDTVNKAIHWGRWASWRRERSREGYTAPYDNDRAAAYTTLTLRVPIDSEHLPAPGYTRDGIPDTETAKTAVLCVIAQVRSAVGDILSALDRDAGAR